MHVRQCANPEGISKMHSNHLGRQARKLGQIKCTQLMSESFESSRTNSG